MVLLRRRQTKTPLLDHLRAQEALLHQAHTHFQEIDQTTPYYISDAAEWLLDNYHLVQQAIRQIREDIDSDGRRRMPAATVTDPSARLYTLARDLITASDGRLKIDQIIAEVNVSQEHEPLTMAEIWALPTLLRLGLVTLLVQTAGQIIGAQIEAPQHLVFPSPTYSNAPGHQLIADCILSLRLLVNYNWSDFFVAVSRVEHILNKDPACIYARMEAETRQQYRRVVQELAWTTGREEEEVAQEALGLAESQPSSPIRESEPWQGLDLPRTTHVGYYLVGAGRQQLEAHLAYRPSWRVRLRRRLSAYLPQVYVGAILLFTGVLALAPALYTLARGGTSPQVIGVALLALLPAMTIVVHLVNWLINLTIPPRQLPKLDFQKGIPACCQTIVAVPALISSAKEAAALLQKVELHYLSNTDPHLYFALLTDFANAPQQQMPDDGELLAQLKKGMRRLNKEYGDAFYLFHRRRRWNPGEDCWMGWECKRGKLVEFNRLLQGRSDTSYSTQIGDMAALTAVKYVITLDADTHLPRDSAHRLVATLAHPLNRPQFDPQRDAVVAGYAVLQPRIEIHPESADHSWFTRIFSQAGGLDLYQRAVSDVYHDLFGEGIYAGKGIYDLKTFSCALADRVPENSLLSHDLFEGFYGRVGLVTDVVLYEEYPLHYLAHTLRLHRWIRGDWQMLPWLLPQTPQGNGQKEKNDLSLLARWKIWDNLRRSLLPPTLLAFLALAWLWMPGSALLWTTIGLLTLLVPHATSLLVKLRQPGSSWANLTRSLRSEALRWLLSVIFLPYEALLSLDAISRTLVRLTITRRGLLQWPTAAHTARQLGRITTGRQHWRQMAGAPLLALVGLLASINSPALLAMAPLLLTWLFSPTIAHLIDQPLIQERPSISVAERQQLRHLARRTWLFFERFVGPEDNWLPPDHFQESPRGTIAHRTSPTNIGLYLLSALAAYDLGYIGPLGLALRLRPTLDTLDKLERYRGHVLNWIDTGTLRALPPRYVSTVDSGNLAACLLTLGQGCHSLLHHPVWRWRQWQGYIDAIALLRETLTAAGEEGSGIIDHLRDIESQVLALRETPRAAEEAWPALLDHLATKEQAELERHLLQMIEVKGGTLDADLLYNLRLQVERVRYHLNNMQRLVDQLLPWLHYLQHPPALFTRPDLPPPFQAAWASLLEALPSAPSLTEVAEKYTAAEVALQRLQESSPNQDPSTTVAEALDWCHRLAGDLRRAAHTAHSLLQTYGELQKQAESYVDQMDFTFLFDRQRQVFHIGYNVEAGRLDGSAYDFLASEARVASLIAIAKNDIPQSHWLHLARPLIRVDGGRTLLSWSGTMFEYLMPALWLRHPTESLLGESCRASIQHQIAYARRRNVPWGISESGFYALDAAMNYHYRAFGVPELGLKRGLGDDLVIAPYASLLALSFAPKDVLQNLQALYSSGVLGPYGLYEAIDFTSNRLPFGQDAAVVRSYMAHHQGMILLALTNYLQEETMIDRLHADPRMHTIELLLHERPPQVSVAAPEEETFTTTVAVERPDLVSPWQAPLASPMPLAHVLSNGRYHTLITNSGSGYSRWQDLVLTRWRSDTTLDNWGCWVYVQDRQSGALWSAGSQPTGVPASRREVTFHPHMAAFLCRNEDITLRMEVTVSPADDVEIRRLRLSNNGAQSRNLRLTSYGEIVLSSAAADRRHPAFAKLFVESEYLPAHNALLFRRRSGSPEGQSLFMAHMLLVEEGMEVTGTFATDRARFLGRGRTARRPAALDHESGLATAASEASLDAPLDPIMVLGQEVDVAPGTTVQMALITAVAASRSDIVALLDHYQSLTAVDNAFEAARDQAGRELRALGLTAADLERFQQLLSLLLYPHPVLRADDAVPAHTVERRLKLERLGISGDHPILLLKLYHAEQLSLLHHLLQAHAHWRRRDLQVDLIVLDAQQPDAGTSLVALMERLIYRFGHEAWLGRSGGIHLLRHRQVDEGEWQALQANARVMLDGDRGSLAEQLGSIFERPVRLPAFVSTRPSTAQIPPVPRPEDLHFDNGLGGFSADGREYLIYLQPGETTPAPWINVIANPDFGCLVSESGGGCTWAVNSAENRLTSWHNDPVCDTPAEALYLRDEETAAIWSPTPQPAPAPAPYLVRHGAGYTIFEHHSHGFKQRLRLFVAPDAPVKVAQLRLENREKRPRRITVTYYAEWVLGEHREITQPHLVPAYDGEHKALLVRNACHDAFAERVAFLAASEDPHGLTADRDEFLGRLGTLARPAALNRIGLENRVQPGLDCCAVLQLHLDLEPGAAREVYFLLGQGADRTATETLLQRFRQPEQVAKTWQAIRVTWDDLLGAVQVQTPDAAMDLFLNRWLLYQTVSCRLWGRTALYQSSGAYGFRDQLQDVMALVHARPELARAHILRAARHQFEAGDVLHWWRPPGTRGLRSRISDNLLWLPYVTAHYVAATGDVSVLAEEESFLQGEPLAPQEVDRYGAYERTAETYSLYEHCRRALEKGITTGSHGLPLIGGGDWNDGFNRLGREGRGESVWLGWFLCATLDAFAALCARTGRDDQARTYQQHAQAYREALQETGWDGAWYRRAYDDEGTPLGAAQNQACRIAANAQSWAVLSGGGGGEREQQAMGALLEHLVRWDDRLLLLFAPPFDHTTPDPGYVKGYLPGVRENGGQYTHAALWAIWAFAQMGQGDLAQRLFRLLHPICRADTAEKVARYRVEPYVTAADVYSVPPHIGRGGWTWYTGSAGWMYRVGLEAILGVYRTDRGLRLDPCIPRTWQQYTVRYQHEGTTLQIRVENPQGVNCGVCQILLDDEIVIDGVVPWLHDGDEHLVVVRLGGEEK